MDVSLRLIRAFLVVAEEENIGRAARRLYISQPALSQDVRRLEREVGVELFVRSHQGVTLTPAGQAFAVGARQATEVIDRAVTEARHADAADRPCVSLAYTPSLGNRLMPALLPVLERLRPEVRVDEREVDTGEAGPAVEAGKVDLGLAHCPDPSPRLDVRPLGDEPLMVALNSGHPLAERGDCQTSPIGLKSGVPTGAVSLVELTGLDLLIWPRDTAPCYYDRILEVCRNAGLEPAVRTGPRRALTRSYLLAQGTFALLPEGAAAVQAPDVTFLQITDPDATVPLALLSRHGDHRPEIAAIATMVEDFIKNR